MLGKKMTNKETHNSLKMDAHILSNKLFEELKDKYIYTFNNIVVEHRSQNLKINVEENDNQPIQLLCQHEKQDIRHIKQFPTNSKRLDNIKENN